MLIDNGKKFDTDKDELMWSKIIRIKPYDSLNDECTHLVKYYKTIKDEEYYLFDYICADNNSAAVNNFNGYNWKEIVKQINFPDHSYIYAQNVTDKNDYRIVTSGKVIKKHIEEYMIEQECENKHENEYWKTKNYEWN